MSDDEKRVPATFYKFIDKQSNKPRAIKKDAGKEMKIMDKNPLLNLQQVKPLEGNRKLHILLPAVLFLLSWMLFSVAIAADTAEYAASEVDKPPKLVRQMPVKYPPKAKRNRVEGRVVVRCLIGVKGKAGKMEIVASEPEGVFDENALKSLKYWQFRPGVLKGEMVATWIKIPLNFEP